MRLRRRDIRSSEVKEVSPLAWVLGASDLSCRCVHESKLAIAVGFGISTPEQVRQVWRFADAAVIGSAIVSEVEKLGNSPNLVNWVGEFARSLVAPDD